MNNNNTISISNEKLSLYKSCFDTFDKDKDGFIELNFILDLIKNSNIGINPNEYDCFISELDFDKSGKINFDEFILLILRKYKEDKTNQNEDLKESFKVLCNGNENMKKENLKKIFDNIVQKCGMDMKISEDELNEMFKEANYGDSKDDLTFENFLKFINKR